MAKLGKLGISVSFKGSEMTFKNGKTVLAVVGSRIEQGKLVKYAVQKGVKVAGRVIAVAFILNAGGQAMASGGEMDAVAKAMAREAVMADVVEGGIKIAVVDIAGNYVKETLYGKVALKRYLEADIDEQDKNNIKKFWSEHPFFNPFGGDE